MTDKQYKEVHTTIPKKCWQYAQDKKLGWNELLIKAIEQEMNTDPDIIKDKLNENHQERERLQQQLQQAQVDHQQKKTKLQDLHKGLIPVD
ncbi:MAG: hypothetical protein H7836_14580 [Magnetococcus sp. YQC-3]